MGAQILSILRVYQVMPRYLVQGVTNFLRCLSQFVIFLQVNPDIRPGAEPLAKT